MEPITRDTALPREGFLFKQNSIKEWLLRYFKIMGNSLYTFKRTGKRWDKIDFSSGKKVASLFLSRVQKSKDHPECQNCFEVISV